MTEQLSLEENDEGALTANISVANWRAFMAPIAEDRGAVVKQPEALYLALAILDAFAQQAGSGGLSRAQVHAALQLGSRRWPTALIDQRLDVLIAMGFLEPYLLKQHQERYVVRPAGLAGALAAERLAMFGGVDELILLLDRAKALIIHDSPDADAVYAVLATCRNALRIFALDLQRRIDTGTPDELIESQHQHDHHAFTRQVADLNNLVTSYFSGNYGMQEAATALIEAEQFYQRNVRAAADKVLEQGGASLNFDVLTPAEYLNAARLGDLDLLAQVGLGLVVDMPSVSVDPQLLAEIVETYAPQVRTRIRPPVPEASEQSEADPFRWMEEAEEQARERRRLVADELLFSRDEADLTQALYDLGWLSASSVIADLLALSGDRREPYSLAFGEQLLADPAASISYLHPLRLTRNGQASEDEVIDGSLP